MNANVPENLRKDKNFSPRYSPGGGSQGEISGEYEGLSHSKTPAPEQPFSPPLKHHSSIQKLPSVKQIIQSTESSISQFTKEHL
jgi:hypothetical protein